MFLFDQSDFMIFRGIRDKTLNPGIRIPVGLPSASWTGLTSSHGPRPPGAAWAALDDQPHALACPSVQDDVRAVQKAKGMPTGS